MPPASLRHSARLLLALLPLALPLAVAAEVKLQPYDLRCEYLVNPLGIDVTTPRFNWKMRDPEATRGQRQTAYHVLVASSKELLNEGTSDLWDSGKTATSQSALVPYGGKPLTANQDCYWKTRVFDKDGTASEWSEPARFSMGLLQPSDWKGPWMHHPGANPVQHVWFRETLTLNHELSSAFLHVASVGYHELYVNGKRVEERPFGPALTRLDKRVLYVTYDLRDLLKPGKNTIALWQGPGWARYAFFKTKPALRLQLNATNTDGRHATLLTSGPQWRCQISSSENIGGIRYKNHGGEKIDARSFIPDWNAVDYDDSEWQAAATTSIDATLSAQMMEPTRIIETLPAKSISKSGDTYKVDLGKNFTGWITVKLRGLSTGNEVTAVIADDAETVQDFAQKSIFISNGDPEETFQNRFNYIAGRYITLTGLKTAPRLADFTGHVLSTDVKRTGAFSSSEPLFNEIYDADLWTWRANLVEGFTMDCPHRERLGYGEVAFACAWGIAFPNYAAGALYTKHVRDWSDVQEENGWIHHTAPQINEHFGGPMWSSAGLNIASSFYQHYGDESILALTYPSSKRWLDFLHSKTSKGLLKNYDEHWGKFLGDWAAPGQRKERGDSPEAEYFNNCVYALNLAEFIEAARILKQSADVALYSKRLEEIRKNTHAKFFAPKTHRYAGGTQVQLAFALLTGITPEHLRPGVVESFEKELSGKPYLDMGSSGLPVLFKYLTEEARDSSALFKLLSKTDEPSYGYFLKRGENTWPEYWNVDVPSKIHTCYTGVASWFTKSLAGIRPDPAFPGFQSFIIKPVIGGGLTFAEATTESPYGTITSRWELNGNTLKTSITIPPNSLATVSLPTAKPDTLTEGGNPITQAEGVTLLPAESGHAVMKVTAGHYEFSCQMN